MKKVILTLFVAGLSLGAFAQGTVLIDNFPNTGVYNGNGGTAFNGASGNPVYSSLVTSNGLIFTTHTASQAGQLGYSVGSSQMLGVDVNFQLFGGATAGQATNLVASAIGSGQIAGDNGNWGQIGISGTFGVPGTTVASTVFLDLKVWEGNFASYALAQAANSWTGDTGAFQNTSGGGATPASHLYGLPDLQLVQAPEPSTFALAGLGAAALMIFRRRK